MRIGTKQSVRQEIMDKTKAYNTRGKEKRSEEHGICIMEEERRKNHALGDPTCQFYIMENERERERKQEELNNIRGRERENGEMNEKKSARSEKREEKHMLNECASRLYARFEIRLYEFG